MNARVIHLQSGDFKTLEERINTVLEGLQIYERLVDIKYCQSPSPDHPSFEPTLVFSAAIVLNHKTND